MDTLRGLIPDDSIVIRKDYPKCNSWQIKTAPMSLWKWHTMVKAIKNEFSDNLLNIYNPDERIRMVDIDRNEKGYIIGFSFARDILEDKDMIGGLFTVYLKKQI